MTLGAFPLVGYTITSVVFIFSSFFRFDDYESTFFTVAIIIYDIIVPLNIYFLIKMHIIRKTAKKLLFKAIKLKAITTKPNNLFTVGYLDTIVKQKE